MLRFFNRRFLGAALLLALFVIFTSSLYFGFSGRTWISPDETATALVAREWASHGTFALTEARNIAAGGVLGPRSMVAVGSSLLPIGFLGIAFIAGLWTAIVGSSSLFLVGPIFGALGLVALYFVVRQLTGDRAWALASTFALAFHPGYVFYSARSLMPNVPFVALIVAAAAVGFMTSGASLVGGLASGALLGAALTVRLFEAPWILGVVIVAFVVARRQLTRKFITGWLFGFLIVMIGLLTVQNNLYGDPFLTGYTTSATVDPALVITSTAASVAAPTLFARGLGLLLPFGFHEWNIVTNLWDYGFVLYPWLTLLALVGAVLIIVDVYRGRLPRYWLAWLTSFAVVGAWLAIVYGSGKIADNPDPSALTLANSYVRYWLPLVVLSAPFVGYAVKRGFEATRSRSRAASIAFVVMLLALGGGLMVWRVTAGPDGIPASRTVLHAGERKRAAIERLTEPNAFVIVDRSDKYVYPSRSVVAPLIEQTTFAALSRLFKSAPVYYLGLPLPERNLQYLNDVYLQGTNLHFEPVTSVEDEFLYVLRANK